MNWFHSNQKRQLWTHEGLGMAPAGYECGWNHPIPVPISLDLTHHPYPYPPTGTKFFHTRRPPG
jgi:hypothetical protein